MNDITEFLVGNDDVIFIATKDKAYDDEQYTEQLGLIISTKSFVSKRGVFFEEYSPRYWKQKRILFYSALERLSFETNMSKKRYIFNSLVNCYDIPYEEVEDILKTEFDIQTPERPYILGGYFTKYS